MHRHIATATFNDRYVELISVNEDVALIARLDGDRKDVKFSELKNVWPVSTTLDTFDQLVSDSNASTATNMVAIFTQNSAWAELIRSTWEGLY